VKARAVKKKSAKKKAVKKQAGRKKATAQRATRTVAKPVKRPNPKAVAPAGCLDAEAATDLVLNCVGRDVPTSTKLGGLFPSDVLRRGFCGRVYRKARAAGVQIEPSAIPCSATNTVQDVIDSLSC
jgi:hypothetical protein